KRILPEFDPGDGLFGQRYKSFNEILNRLAHQLQIDLWTLDLLWWKVLDENQRNQSLDEIAPQVADRAAALVFQLEEHLHEFLLKNWEQLDGLHDWALHVEEGEIVGSKYVCEVGQIDVLAKHKTEPRWLVLELKRSQTGDTTLGQLLRYMG